MVTRLRAPLRALAGQAAGGPWRLAGSGTTSLLPPPLRDVGLRTLLTSSAGEGAWAPPLWSGQLTLARSLAAKRVDPERPKRPKSAWLRFMLDFRARKPEGLENKAVLKAAAAEWKVLSADERKPFEDAYAADMVPYQAKVNEYVSSGAKDAFKRDPDKPKKPLTGFFRFLQEKRKTSPDGKVTELTTKMKEEWAVMTEAQRKPYNDAFAQEQATYHEALKVYKASGKEEVWKAKVGIKTDAQKEAEKKALAEEKKAAKEAAAQKKKDAADKKKAAAAKKRQLAAAKKQAAAERKKAAVDKKKAKAAELKAKKLEVLAKRKEALAKRKEALNAKKKALASKA